MRLITIFLFILIGTACNSKKTTSVPSNTPSSASVDNEQLAEAETRAAEAEARAEKAEAENDENFQEFMKEAEMLRAEVEALKNDADDSHGDDTDGDQSGDLKTIPIFDNVSEDLNEFMAKSPVTLEITCGGVVKQATRTSNTTEITFAASLFESLDTKCNSIILKNNLDEKIAGTFVRPNDGRIFDHPNDAVVGWFSQEKEYEVHSHTTDNPDVSLLGEPIYMVLTCAGITKKQLRTSSTTKFKFPSIAFAYSETKCTHISLENNSGKKVEGTFNNPDTNEIYARPDPIIGWW